MKNQRKGELYAIFKIIIIQIHEELLQINNSEHPKEKWAKDFNKRYSMFKKHMKMCSTSLVTKEIQNTTKMAKTGKDINTIYLQGCRATHSQTLLMEV